jgi:hypothetical protein
MRREAVIGLMALIAILTLAVSSVGISPRAEAAELKDVSITKIAVNITELERINGEVTAALFNMDVFIEHQNLKSVSANLEFAVSGEGTDKFIYRKYDKIRITPRSVININEKITNKYIIAYLTKENPIIYVHCFQLYGGVCQKEQDFIIELHDGSGSWPPSSAYVTILPEPLQKRPETIFAIVGLILVAYMLLQPKKKNLKIRTAARLGLLCIVLNLLGLGIFSPVYFIFIVAAILAYSCLLLKQKSSATLVMFVYSIVGTAIMVFFYLLFDVTSNWDYLHLARFAVNAFYLLPTEVPGGFILSILFGVSIGIIADVIYAISKGDEAYGAVFIGLIIAIFVFFIFIGGLASLPGGLEGPGLAIVFLILFPMIIFGALGGYLGYFIYKKRRNSEAVSKIQES